MFHHGCRGDHKVAETDLVVGSRDPALGRQGPQGPGPIGGILREDRVREKVKIDIVVDHEEEEFGLICMQKNSSMKNWESHVDWNMGWGSFTSMYQIIWIGGHMNNVLLLNVIARKPMSQIGSLCA